VRLFASQATHWIYSGSAMKTLPEQRYYACIPRIFDSMAFVPAALRTY